MISNETIGLADVQAVYSGPEGDLWELIMGEQIHIGGFASSLDLAELAGIGPGMAGIDLCCCSGAGMRFLVRCRGVERMQGVDATGKVVQRGRARCEAEGLSDRIEFCLADACRTGLPSDGADFVWGEDAWCYVVDKQALIAEAARLLQPGGTIAFTDWVEGPEPMTEEEGQRYLRFMRFPSVLSPGEYRALLETNGCTVVVAEDTGRFAPHVDLYLQMLDMQLTYDALAIIGFDMEAMSGLKMEMEFMQGLAHSRKIGQGRFVARKSA